MTEMLEIQDYGDAEAAAVDRFELDLRGLCVAQAMNRLDLLIRIGRDQGVRSLWVRLDQDAMSGGPALFVPVGRKLIEAWRRGDISHCRPLSAAEGGGYYVYYSAGAPLEPV